MDKQEVISSLEAVSHITDLNEFVRIIKLVLKEKKSEKGGTSKTKEENKHIWASFSKSGSTFLKFFLQNTAVAEILDTIAKVHWMVGVLAIPAYLIEKFEKVSSNKAEAFQLLENMVDLASIVVRLNDVIPEEEEKLKNAVDEIVQGSIMCFSQRHSKKIHGFFKTSTNSQNLIEMSKRLNHLYTDIDLAITARTAEHLLAMEKRQAKFLPVQKPKYPEHAVGIKNAQEEVLELLNMAEKSILVVVIYGFGGIGKTTLANSVVAKLNLKDYNYARVLMDEDLSKNDLVKMQKVILNDAFPKFQSGNKIKLRDSKDGRDCLEKAFRCSEKEPVFLYIDNLLRSTDLGELLPPNFSELPERSRIFLTTRKLDATNVLNIKEITFCPFAMRTLDDDFAAKILCKDLRTGKRIKDDMKRILRICGGVPLALKVVGGHLSKMGFDARKCRQIIDAMEKDGHVKEDETGRLIDLVYNDLEDGIKDALLDICCFFNGWLRRHVEYVVGVREVEWLVSAALVTSVSEEKNCGRIYFREQRDWGRIYGGEERLQVHDIVRAKGRTISESTRFTDVESFSKAAQDETKLNGIKGLWFKDSSSEYVLDVKHLNSMRHSLRIMSLGSNMKTSAQSRMKFDELRYLSVHGSRSEVVYVGMIAKLLRSLGVPVLSQVPRLRKISEFLRYIGVLNVPHQPMKVEELDRLGMYKGPIDPNGISLNKLPKSLSFIIQVGTFATWEESSFTQGRQNHSLEELQLTAMKDIQMLEALHQLSSLKILILHVEEIEEFPEQVFKLPSLRKLGIYGGARLKRLPQLFGGLKGLTHLEIVGCSELEELPSSFGELRALEHLSLSDCTKLKWLPGGLESLKYLSLSSCGLLDLGLYRQKRDLIVSGGRDSEKLRLAVLVSKAAFQFITGEGLGQVIC